MVEQNANTLTPNNSDPDPLLGIYLHGHDLWVLGNGKGSFHPQVDVAYFQSLRNTVAVRISLWMGMDNSVHGGQSRRMAVPLSRILRCAMGMGNASPLLGFFLFLWIVLFYDMNFVAFPEFLTDLGR